MKGLNLLMLLCVCACACAQKSFLYTYGAYGNGDTTRLYVHAQGPLRHMYYEDSYAGRQTIPGFAHSNIYMDLEQDSVWQVSDFGDEAYCVASRLSTDRYEWQQEQVDKHTVRYITWVNSNKLEFEMSDKYREDVSPMTSYGRLPGTLLRFKRNGQVYYELLSAAKSSDGLVPVTPEAKRLSARELNNLKQEKMILTTHVFDHVQLHWGAEAQQVPAEPEYDSVYHFAGGTVALKRIRMQQLPEHYQLFAELHQCSNGDAYDRTGSLFVIPQGREHTFFEGMRQHPDSLPLTFDKKGGKYQGIVATDGYLPIVELVRFFTPFGVKHFNDRVQIEGLEWADEAYYKQEITDLSPLLQGDVWVGVFIGNYDGGGHRVSLDIKAYPNSELWELAEKPSRQVLPLFATTNVLEMAGQNYGQLFGTDTLKVEFDIPEGCGSIRLRYLCTGHGGWGEGDEFVPKQSDLCIDGDQHYYHTPWRGDCGTFRELNPVSGNFWNGTSSSDYSRSGWCPGTATQPVYFDLSHLSPGHHTLTLTIPQGEPVEGGFSHWNVSGAVVIENLSN